MRKFFPVLILLFFLLSIFSFVVAGENTEPESFSVEETSSESFSASSDQFDQSESYSEVSPEDVSYSDVYESTSDLDKQDVIINRLNLLVIILLFAVSVACAVFVCVLIYRFIDGFISF